MFTGIITALGTINAINDLENGRQLCIDIGKIAEHCEIGDSIAVNGACLTVTGIDGPLANFDISGETLLKTTIADWQQSHRVNLEAALCLGDKLGGHMVSGHIDGVGKLEQRQSDGDCEVFTFSLPESGTIQIVEKGSIAIDGISLTCYHCQNQQFQVAVIPHTLQETNLGTMRSGDHVHMEQDMIGRWVATLLPQQD
jgi:riboflavin synthase